MGADVLKNSTYAMRFNQWRGPKAGAEQQYLKTAMLIVDYVETRTSIEMIKHDLISINSPKFKEIAAFKEYIFSILLYAKLELEEILSQKNLIEEHSNTEKSQLFITIIEIVKKLYEDIYKAGADNFNTLLRAIKTLVSMDIECEQEDKTLCYILYTTLRIIKLWFDTMGKANLLLISAKINVPEFLDNVTGILEQLEQRGLELSSRTNSGQPKPLYVLLSEIISHQIPTHTASPTKLSELTARLLQLERLFTELITLKEQQLHIQEEEIQTNKLYQLILENENKLFNSESFINLISGSNLKVFNCIIQKVSGPKKELLLASLSQPQNISSPFFNSLNKGYIVTCGVTATFWRTKAPSYAQQLIQKIMPKTLDRECTENFKEFAQIHIADLNEQSTAIETRIFELSKESTGNKKAALNIKICSIKEIQSLHAVIRSAHLCASDFTNVANILKAQIEVLDHFLEAHDGIFVKISNFLAQFSLIFKSKTAKLIDVVLTCKNTLKEFEADCLNDLMSLDNPHNPNDIYLEFQQRYKQFQQQTLKLPTTVNKTTLLSYVQDIEVSMAQYKTSKPILKQHFAQEPFEYKSSEISSNPPSSSLQFFHSSKLPSNCLEPSSLLLTFDT
ncbi:MAG: hypothetical protein H0U75_05415 [Legionella sp.]|nr:hypothetical protein [Legionella sp.]